jgi:hypothetical protein
MSGTSSSLPVYTIQVGQAGTFTNDATVDISATVNAELKAAPVGYQIRLVFNPGTYGETGTILLPSNTTVIGNNAVLSEIFNPNSPGNGGALMANADAYAENNTIYDQNTNGTVTVKPYSSTNTSSMPGNSAIAIVDSNISIQGMTFNATGNTYNGSRYVNGGYTMFGTWFINATNIDVQNNTYIGGTDGNAFVNVSGGIVMGNTAIGVINAAYDNWDGPTNLTVADNSTFMSATPYTGWSVLLNSTPTGDPANPGNAVNDVIVENVFASNIGSSAAIDADPLLSYGSTSESNIVQQGNVISDFGNQDVTGLYAADTSNSVMQDNLVSGAAELSSQFTPYYIDSYGTSAPNQSQNVQFFGNEALGETATATGSLLQSNGENIQQKNNANIAAPGTNPGLTAGQSLTKTLKPLALDILTPPNVFVTGTSSIGLNNITIEDQNSNDIIHVTITAQEGIVSLGTPNQVLSQAGIQFAYLVGSVATVNAELEQLDYTPAANGWDDNIAISVTNGAGAVAVRELPVINSAGEGLIAQLTTIAPGMIDTSWLDAQFFPGQSVPAGANLNGEYILASAGNNVVTMGSVASVALLGTGNNTVYGGSTAEYIAGGVGAATLYLAQGGDVTVAGGAGALTISASTGNDLIETGSATASIQGGGGSVTVASGLGTLNYVGGSGQTFMVTLPANGGNIVANMGTGNATVEALSGDGQFTTNANTQNSFYLGIGDNVIRSGGNDFIFGGFGNATVMAQPGGSDTVLAGTGAITYISGNSIKELVSAPGQEFEFSYGLGSPVQLLPTSTGNSITAFGDATIAGSAGISSVVGGAGVLTYSDGTSPGGRSIQLGSGGGVVTFGTGSDTVQGSTGAVTVQAAATSSIRIALGVGGGSVSGSLSGQTVISTAAGASDDIVIGSSGAGTGIVTSNGSDSIVDQGAATVVAMAASTDHVTVQGGTLNFSIGSDKASGTADATILLCTGQATVNAAAWSTVNIGFSGSNNRLNFINSSVLAQTVSGGNAGSVTVSGGVGGGQFFGGSMGNNSLIGGAGVVTLTGGGAGDLLVANSSRGTNIMNAGVGPETLEGTSLTNSNIFSMSDASDGLVSSSGAGMQTFEIDYATGTTSTLVGSAASGASNLFNFIGIGSDSGGTYYIRNFLGPTAELEFSGASGIGPGNTHITGMATSVVGGMTSTVISMSNNSQITIMGAAASSLQTVTLANGIVTVVNG